MRKPRSIAATPTQVDRVGSMGMRGRIDMFVEKVLFRSMFEAECMAWLFARPSVNGMIDKGLDGYFRVLDMG